MRLIFLLSIISGAMSTESFLRCCFVIIRGDRGVFRGISKTGLSRQGGPGKKKARQSRAFSQVLYNSLYYFARFLRWATMAFTSSSARFFFGMPMAYCLYFFAAPSRPFTMVSETSASAAPFTQALPLQGGAIAVPW